MHYDPIERGHQKISCSTCGYKGWSDDSGDCPSCEKCDICGVKGPDVNAKLTEDDQYACSMCRDEQDNEAEA